MPQPAAQLRTRLARGVVALALACAGCDWWPAYQARSYDRDIEKAARAVEAAATDAQRATALAERGRAYSERARYSRSFKQVSFEEYGRLFDLAIKDHDQAVALAPGDAQLYLSRGRTYYDRAAVNALDSADPAAKTFLEPAKADFSRAIERDARNETAWDMRGVVHASRDEHDLAIADFAAVMKLNPHLGKLRLAEAHCRRASELQKQEKYDAAIADYEKSIDFGVATGHSDCQPESALAWIHLEKRDYDRSWEVVRRARSSGRGIAPEVLEPLKKATGKTQ
jgi:tetratricopeptide (TPR) repeat protein